LGAISRKSREIGLGSIPAVSSLLTARGRRRAPCGGSPASAEGRAGPRRQGFREKEREVSTRGKEIGPRPRVRRGGEGESASWAAGKEAGPTAAAALAFFHFLLCFLFYYIFPEPFLNRILNIINFKPKAISTK